jgi:hypothetical protein
MMISGAMFHGIEDIRLHVIGVRGWIFQIEREAVTVPTSQLHRVPPMEKVYHNSGRTPCGEETSGLAHGTALFPHGFLGPS